MASPFMYASPEQVMKDKADYARKGIARGKPIVVIEYTDGVAFVASNPSATLHKVSEVYDRIAFAGVGKYSEYENLRIAGIRNAELKGFTYSRSDVNARSLANMYSAFLGQMFTDALKPFEVEILIAEVGEPNDLYRVSYDGTVFDEHDYVVMGGNADEVTAKLKDAYSATPTLDEAVAMAKAAIGGDGPFETAVLDRNAGRRKFRRL